MRSYQKFGLRKYTLVRVMGLHVSRLAKQADEFNWQINPCAMKLIRCLVLWRYIVSHPLLLCYYAILIAVLPPNNHQLFWKICNSSFQPNRLDCKDDQSYYQPLLDLPANFHLVLNRLYNTVNLLRIYSFTVKIYKQNILISYCLSRVT